VSVAIVGAAAFDVERALANPRARKMMSRGAYLAAVCAGNLVRDVGWTALGDVGYFLGVGASGGSLDDVTALLDASISDGKFSIARFGDRGLAACNPLLAFQLMNNFTLCHGAILEGIGGPNSALFSRGAGTTAALVEAVHAIASGDCDRAIAGGADSALHPVTRAELARGDFIARGLVPAEGAAMVALARADAAERTLAIVEHAAIASSEGRSLADALDEAVGIVADPRDAKVVVLAPWGPPAADALATWTRARVPHARVVDLSSRGDALAATQALAWLAALDELAMHDSALVLGAGTDGDVGVVLLGRPS
jgi:3-oxoacyl-(acyl-carrier-protein) synthase